MGMNAKVTPVYHLRGVVQAVHAFLEGYGEGYVNTADATADAMDIAAGKSAYVDGKKVSGRVPVSDFALVPAEEVSGSDDSVSLKFTQSQRGMYNRNAEITVFAPLSDFGDAAAGDVAKGKIFTSRSGLRVIGLSEEAGGISTADATAAAEDIAVGKTAYVAGNRVTGTVPVVDFALENATSYGGSEQYVSMMLNHRRRTLYNEGASLSLSAPVSGFGDATAEDVAEGKTFTSAAGFKVTGKGKTGSIVAQGYGDTIIITTSAEVRSFGDDIIIGG